MKYSIESPVFQLAKKTAFTELEVDNFLAITNLPLDKATLFLSEASGIFTMSQIMTAIQNGKSYAERISLDQEIYELGSRLNQLVDRKK